MVAGPPLLSDRFVPPPPPFVAGRWRVVRLTREDAESLRKRGTIPEDATTELLDGLIVLKDRSAVNQDPTMIGREHRYTVEALSNLRKLIDADTRHVETQQSLVCTDTHVPEPDFLILRGRLLDYADLPTAADAYCVVEVADSSYERDRGEKLEGYARAGVQQYVIINLRNRTAEVYTRPDPAAGSYPPAFVLSAEQTLPLRVGETEEWGVRVGDLLPPTTD